MSESSSRRRRRRVSMKLVSPSCSWSKLVEIWVEEEEIVNLEFICAALGLDEDDPSSLMKLKLNRHLISSNNSNLTWQSLLSFFASRGFPTGSSSNNPIIIHAGHGNHLLQPHTNNKRGHDPWCTDNWDTYSSKYNSAVKQNAQLEDVTVFKKQKIDNNNAGTRIPSSGQDGDHQSTRFSGLSLKRKPTVEDVSMLKKKKLNEGNPDSQLGCSCISGSKRPREV